MTDVNISASADNSALLIKLLEGQAAGQTEMRIQNTRLFGGDGQQGAIPFVVEQHKELTKTMTDGFEAIKLLIQTDSTKQNERMNAIENKQYWMSGIGAGAGAFIGSIATFFGLKH